MDLTGHLLYYQEGKHKVNLENYVQLNQLKTATDAINNSVFEALKNKVDSIINITYLDLKNLRDNAQLIPGTLYRITDYQCTTTQEGTQSAGHQFDIVLLALSADKLAEEGWAMEHTTDVYDVTFTGDNVTKSCYINIVNDELAYIIDVDTKLGTSVMTINVDEYSELITDEENKTATTLLPSIALVEENLPYNYFQNSNLSAWKVWYCLDNDTNRFAWAQVYQEGSPTYITRVQGNNISTLDENHYVRNSEIDFVGAKSNYYGWTCDNTNIFTTSETPSNGDSIYNTEESNAEKWNVFSFNEGSPQIDEGKGVIYRLIDEFNNDVAYDFKNIQFVRKLTDGVYDADNGTDAWVYTLNNIDENQQPCDASLNTTIYDSSANNKIDSLYTFINDKNYFALPDVVILNGGGYNNITSCQTITILQGVFKMFGCSDCVIGDANSQFYICDALTTTYNDDPAIYINNKKVLTET